MPTLRDKTIEKPIIAFECNVLKESSDMFYQHFTGKLIPITKEHWENWTIYAETKEGALKIAKYHFFRSKEIVIK